MMEKHLSEGRATERAALIEEIIRRKYPLEKFRHDLHRYIGRKGLDSSRLEDILEMLQLEKAKPYSVLELLEAYEYICALSRRPVPSLENTILELRQDEWEERLRGPEALVVHELWGKKTRWTVDQAVALAMNLNPDLASYDFISTGLSTSRVAIDFRRLRQLIMSAQPSIVTSSGHVSPEDFASWCAARGFGLPEALLSAIQDRPRASDFGGDEEFDVSIKDSAYPTNITALRVTTLQRMVLAMAVDMYGFDPDYEKGEGREPSFSVILNAMKDVGLGGSPKTVRNALISALNWARANGLKIRTPRRGARHREAAEQKGNSP
jgi:hypothetical protein